MPQLTIRQIQDIEKLVSDVVGSNTDPARLLDMARRNGPRMLTDKQLEIALAYKENKTPEQVHDEIAEQVAALLHKEATNEQASAQPDAQAKRQD